MLNAYALVSSTYIYTCMYMNVPVLVDAINISPSASLGCCY